MFDPQKLEFVIDTIPEEYSKEVIKLAAESMKLSKWNFELKTFEHSQNYFGVIVPFVIRDEKICDDEGQETEKGMSLVLKLAPTKEAFRTSGALTKMYRIELYAYSTLLKKYKEMQKQYSLSRPIIVPEYYYGREELHKEALVLQNMVEDGYKPYVRCMFLDYEHTIVALKALATFHALSFILREKDKTLFEEASKVFLPLNREVNSRFMAILENRLLKAHANLCDTMYAMLLERLEKNYADEVEAVFKAVEGLVFCHGDMWKENLLFKIIDDEICCGVIANDFPASVCILDFQNVRLGSPAFDVLYLIASSTTSELRNKSYDSFLKTYYESFEGTLEEAGLEAKMIYSKESFMKDLKTVAPAAFIIANTALWLSCGLQEEGHVRSRRVFTNVLEKKEALDYYISLITGIIEDFIKYGYFDLCDCSSNFKSPYF